MDLDVEDLQNDRVEDWKENHPELFEEHKDALFNLVLASSADQLEHLAKRLEEMSSEIRDEVNEIDQEIVEGGTE